MPTRETTRVVRCAARMRAARQLALSHRHIGIGRCAEYDGSRFDTLPAFEVSKHSCRLRVEAKVGHN